MSGEKSEVISDKNVADVLSRVVWIVNPVLDVLAGTDPLGLKERTKRTEPSDGSPLDRGLDVLAWTLNVADVPGTKAWDEMTVDQRSRWWIRRVGALNTLIVAYPGVFGALADRFPLQDALGFANQAILLCAVARERGLTDQHDQVRMLAAVLCHRTLPDDVSELAVDAAKAPLAAEQERSWTPFALAKTLWRIARIVRGITAELGRRPHSNRFFHLAGKLPIVGVVGDYFGEFGALSRAAHAGERWIVSS